MSRNDANARMMAELEKVQEDLADHWIDQSLPDEWDGLDFDFPVKRPTTRVTLRLDADMVRWFRKLGPGYGARINRILRIYYGALQAGHIHAHPQDNPLPRIKAEAFRIMEAREKRLAEYDR